MEIDTPKELNEYINDFEADRCFIRNQDGQEEYFDYEVEIGFKDEYSKTFSIEFRTMGLNFEVVMLKSPIELQQMFGW